ncbi:MAG: SIMPL domain-containing protein [Alphaproteobacteria bacterium]|nr:SIMPL domain-containing protein [Alphaproteobacteria bacterium]
MKSFLAACLFLILLAGCGYLGYKYYLEKPQQGTVNLSTSADGEVMPDVVEISVTVKTDDKNSLAAAAKENKEKSDKVYGMLAGMINTKAGDYIKTANYNAQPVYVYDNELKRRVMEKYEVSNSIIVHTKNIAQLGEMIDRAIGLGATDVNDLKFSVSGYEDKCRELLQEAGDAALARAKVVAKAAGTKVVGVRSINAGCSENNQQHVPYRMMAKMAMATADGVMNEAMPATPIQSGTVKIFANFNADYFIE